MEKNLVIVVVLLLMVGLFCSCGLKARAAIENQTNKISKQLEVTMVN